MSTNSDEKYLASAVYYLMQTGKIDIAKMLMSCEAEIEDDIKGRKHVTLRGSPEFFKKYKEDFTPDWDVDGSEYEEDGPFRNTITGAFDAIFPFNVVLVHAAIGLVDFDTDWRTRLLAEYDTKGGISNQNPWVKEPIIWNGMRFTSPPEVEIAKALERAGVIYLPNCLVRVGAPNNQQTLFPDFLICYRGKWGILEVDGQTYHQGTATQDYERMRKLTQHVAHFDRYPAKRCTSEPDKVVSEFLGILGNK